MCIIILYVYLISRQNIRYTQYINDAKTKLKLAGFIYNHSYRLVHKTKNKIAYIRIFSLKYSPDNKKVMAHAYMVTKNGEIGEWYDEYMHLLEIKNKWNIEDCGEWNPN